VQQESLRLFGPGPISARYVPDGVTFAGHTVPAGSTVVWSSALTQRLPEHWEDPDRFEPQRWLEGPAPAPAVFAPFGGGYRRCIGFAMANLEVKVILATLLRRAELELRSRRVRPAGFASMYPKGGLRVSASPRRPG
jgi:cytochrome P450